MIWHWVYILIIIKMPPEHSMITISGTSDGTHLFECTLDNHNILRAFHNSDFKINIREAVTIMYSM